MTKKAAWDKIEEFKGETNYFSGCLKLDDMKDMLRNRMQFGEAEAEVILAALTIAGAKFQEDEKEVSEAWKKEKARKAKKAEQFGEEMDRAIADGDDDGFDKAYSAAFGYMGAKERSAYFRRYLESRKGRA